MGNIGTIKRTNDIVLRYNLKIRKQFGQNFIIDPNILKEIVKSSGVNKDINVIEIGPGIGSLTEILLENANKVMSYEIDNDLIPVLKNELKDYDNFILLNQDFLKADLEKDIKDHFGDEKDIYVVANLPYYITTPIIMNILENKYPFKRLTLMMQKEVADRITSGKGGKEYNNLTIAVKYYANAKKVLNVSKNVFMPKPNVDSAVVNFDIYPESPYKVSDEAYFFKLIRNAFANRRKTLVNNLNQSYGMSKETLEKLLESLNIDKMARAESLEIEDFIILAEKLKNV